MLNNFLRRACAALLGVLLFTAPASALDLEKVVTQFDEVLYQIERYGLFAEDNELTDSQRAACNARIDGGESLSVVVNEILSKHDTHSYYMTPDEYGENFAALTNNYVGIGITVQQLEDQVVIMEVNYGGPAREAGVEPGDLLTAVNGVSIAGKSLEDVSGLLRGAPGTTVALTIERAGQPLQMSVTRREIHGDYVWSKTLDEGIEYICVEAFASMDDAEHFLTIWDTLDDRQTAAVLIDLRGNGGGLVDAALTILDEILQKPTEMVTCRWRRDRGGPQTITSEGGGLPLNGIYVLVDGNTASAAELMAACLKDSGSAVLVGETTFGKSQGQYHLTMGNGDSLIITTLEMSTPKTGVWEGLGITPDIETPSMIPLGDYLPDLPELPDTRPLLVGETGVAIQALTERLHLLGLLEQAGDTFTADVLVAVRSFQETVGLEPSFCANTATLMRLNRLMEVGAGYYVDNALEKALAEARTAAEKPLKYQSTADGNWKAA